MKKIFSLVLLLFASICTAGGHIEQHCYPPDGKVYTFDLFTGEADRWDSEKNENPPLSVKKAMDIATDFIKTIPLGEKMQAWRLQTVTLKRMSQDPEEWIYQIHFVTEPNAGNWNGPLPWFIVIVRMDGTIPKYTVQKQAKEN